MFLFKESNPWTVDFDTLEDDMLSYIIACGVKFKKIKEILLRNNELALIKALSKCCALRIPDQTEKLTTERAGQCCREW